MADKLFLREENDPFNLQEKNDLKKPKKIKFQKLLDKIKTTQNSKLDKTVQNVALGGGNFKKLKDRI